MAFPTITDLPSAPQRTQTPDAFATTADTFVAALPDLVTEVNAAGDYIDTKTISVGNAFQGTYSAGTTYTTGQSVLYSSKFYLSLVDSNTGNTPSSSPSQWQEILGEPLPDQSGNAGLFLSTDGTNLSWASAGGGTINATASGSLTNGDLVKLNSDGTVSVIQGGGFGTEAQFESNSTDTVSCTFDSNSNKIVVAYKDGTVGNGEAVVGTVSGSSISFGTPVTFKSGNISGISTTFDSNSNKVVIAYRDDTNSNYGTAIVGTVSGTSISFGTPTVFSSTLCVLFQHEAITYDANAQKVVIVYYDGGNSNYGTAVVGNVSGTSISFGTPVVYNSNLSSDNSITYDANAQKVVIAYSDLGSSYAGKAIVGTVSGTSISFGTPATFESGTSSEISIVYDASAQKVVTVCRDQDNSSYGTAAVGTVSGTSISFGTPVVFHTGDAREQTLSYDSNLQKIVVAFRWTNNNYGSIVVGTVSGTSISFTARDEFTAETTTNISITFDSNSNKTVIAYRDSSGFGDGITFSPTDVGDWIGFASADVSDGSTATINIVSSVNEGQTGLTTGSKYYLPDSGILSTTSQDGREVGRAIAADKIMITQGSIS